MEKIFEKINKLINTKEYHLFINNKIIVSAKSLKSLKEKIKEDFENPTEDIKCFIVSISLDKNYKYPVMINCSQYTITTKLGLFIRSDDNSQTFTYSEKELDEYGFKISHIKKMMKAIEKDEISFEERTIPISMLLMK
jgi:hypothetical protein